MAYSVLHELIIVYLSNWFLSSSSLMLYNLVILNFLVSSSFHAVSFLWAFIQSTLSSWSPIPYPLYSDNFYLIFRSHFLWNALLLTSRLWEQHHNSAPNKKKERRGGTSQHYPNILFISWYFPESGQIVTCSCKGGWEWKYLLKGMKYQD